MMKPLIPLLILIIFISSCSPRLYEIKETQDIMDTFVTITVHHEDKELAKEAVGDAFARIKKIEGLLSSYEPGSEVWLLNENKFIDNPSDELRINIEKSIYYSKLSGGSFDITVQPILDLYSSSFGNKGRAPTDEEIEKELEKVDFTRIKLTEDNISIGMDQKITLGGIAKGYAVEEAIGILKEYGIKNALINAGGDMRGIGKKYGNLDWTIALENPRNNDEFVATFKLSDRSIVTSGDYERYFNENKSFHHIVDPKTGYSATELISVTIITDNAFDADAISTAVFALGKENGLALIENLDDTDGLLITSDKEILKTY
jgi:thiamine biosynthesis lipoprotein